MTRLAKIPSCSGADQDRISDGIVTEVLDGLKESDRVVSRHSLTGAQTTTATSNPFGGGGMPRMR